MRRLRRLLLGRDYDRLAAMREDLARVLALEREVSDRGRRTDLVAGVLSEALRLRENRDRGVSRALRPAISDAIKASVRHDPQPVVEAVSPVIGPAIRRAVNDAISGMLELLDKLLEHNLSWQALQWRIEAWRSGRHYSEIVLLRTLIYRVDQVLLIHRETGLLLGHVEAAQVGVRDPDLVGGMLTAIKDFLSDSFSAPEAPVQTMQVGDFRVIVEQGRLALLAAIVRGNPPSELAGTIRETLETIEVLYRDALACFDGDATPFAEAEGLLAECLKSQQRPPAGRRPWLAPAILALLAVGPLAYWGVGAYQAHARWSEALEALRNEPGFVVTETGRRGGTYRVAGLRDPLSREPEEVIGPEARSALHWEWSWRPFLSMEPELLVERAKQVLQPPPSVALSLEGDILELSGEAPKPWVDAMHVLAPRIPGIAAHRDEALETTGDPEHLPALASEALSALRDEPGIVVTDAVREGQQVVVYGLRDPLARDPLEVIGPKALSALEWDWSWRPFLSAEEAFVLARARLALRPPPTVALSLDGGVLRLSGEASRQWFEDIQRSAAQIPGISGYRYDDLKLTDSTAPLREALARYRQRIEGTGLYFDVDAMRLGQDQLTGLDALARSIQALSVIAGELGLTPRFLVTGYADATGSPARNQLLSFSRARGVVEELVARGVSERLFLPLRMGVGVASEAAPEDRARNRRVTLELVLLADGGAGGIP
jgi:OOP family OmpA-OmpF porin